jgi:integrase
MLDMLPERYPGDVMARLTAKSVEAERSAKARREIPDAYLPGLYLIVQPSGAKSWAVRYRHEGRPRKHTLGPYPLIDLKAARETGSKALRAAAEGADPASAKKQTADSLEAAVEQFIERHVRRNYRPKPLKEAERLLRKHVLEKWRGRKISEIRRTDLRNMLEEIVEDGAPIAANRVHSIARKFFNWCLEHEIIEASPCAGLKAPAGKEDSRDRVLSEHEIRQVWQAAEKLGPLSGALVRLLILTGQRRGEVAGMEWSELDFEKRLWTLPRERVKNDRRHEVPLLPQTIAILKGLPRVSDRFVFSLNATSPINGFGKDKERLDALSGMADWVLHDLRRTVASGMARLGVSLAVIEKVLNHVSGSFAGIVGVYQRHEFAEEKRQALEKWADYVSRITAEVAGAGQ